MIPKIYKNLPQLTKIKSKGIEDSNVRSETIKVLGKKKGKISLTLALAIISLIWNQKHKQQKQKKKKVGLYPTKKLLLSKRNNKWI